MTSFVLCLKYHRKVKQNFEVVFAGEARPQNLKQRSGQDHKTCLFFLNRKAKS
jgi:hypothetical protein